MQILSQLYQSKFNSYVKRNNLSTKQPIQNCNNKIYTNNHIASGYNVSFSGQKTLDYLKVIYTQNKIINFQELMNAGIPNLKLVYNRGVRGETLSASRNSKYLPLVKSCGIDTIIDLRTTDYTKSFKDRCCKLGFNYIHIPIDKALESDRNILDSLPNLFNLLKRGKFYIACAQGKHRTDIALAINYVFNPKEKVPPFMSGHTNHSITDMADINRRLNSLYKALTDTDRKNLGWPDNYDEIFLQKKRLLQTYSESQ